MAGKKKQMPDEFWTDLAEIYPTRNGGRIIAAKYNVSGGFVCDRARERGISSEHSRLTFYRQSLSSGHFEAMLREWIPQRGGKKNFCEMFGVTAEVIRLACHRYGVFSQNAQAMQHNRDNLQVDYFDILDAERSYWLGYIWADASVSESKRRGCVQGLYLGCKTTDEGLILDLRERLNSHHVVHRRFAKDKEGNLVYDRHGNPIQRTSVFITSPELGEILRDIYGILPRKSFIDPPFPKWVTPELLPHFARGVFDGDGCCCQVRQTYYSNRMKYLLYYMGSKIFIHELQDRIIDTLQLPRTKPQNDKGGLAWLVMWQSLSDIEKLYHWMYPTSDVVCLPRKRDYLERIFAGEPVPETGGEPMDDENFREEEKFLEMESIVK